MLQAFNPVALRQRRKKQSRVGAWKKENKYICIVKVGADKFIKYSYVRNLMSFTNFLDKNFPAWRWYNVFWRPTGQQLASFTKNNRPTATTLANNPKSF